MMTAIYNFFDGLLHLAGSTLHVGLMVVLLLIGLTVLATVVRRLKVLGKGKLHGSKHGFFHVHETTDYDRKPSINKRKAAEVRAAKQDAEGKTGTESAESQECTADCSDKPVAVIRFDNDVMASYSGPFSRLVSEIIANKDRFSKVVVAANSPGGSVAEYGLMYSETERLRKACDSVGIELIGSIRTYGASGGMLELLPCHKIYASPMAMVGSIGVVSEMLNFNKFWKSLGVEPLTMTAGEFKRTVTANGEVTEEGKAHYLEQLKSIHNQFIAAVKKYRKGFDDEAHVNKVCSGAHWTAQESIDLKLGLIDGLATTQELLFDINQNSDLVFLSVKQNPFERGIFRFFTKLIDYALLRVKSMITGDLR